MAKRCAACGREFEDWVAFCMECGSPLVSPRGGDAGGAARKEQVAGVVIEVEDGAVFRLEEPGHYVIGRGEQVAVDLARWTGASGVSRRHALVVVEASRVTIEDLESRNSTLLNGYRLLPRQRYPLKPGDQVRVGSVQLVVRAAGGVATGERSGSA